MTQWSPMAATLVRSAKNRSWREQAACWLLAESGVGESHWPDRLEEAGLIAWEMREAEDWDLAFVRWELLPADLSDPQPDPVDGLYGTDAQWCVLRFACALMNGRGGDWGADLPRLDASNRRILLGALAWAAGGQSSANPYIIAEEPSPPPSRPKLHSVD